MTVVWLEYKCNKLGNILWYLMQTKARTVSNADSKILWIISVLNTNGAIVFKLELN